MHCPECGQEILAGSEFCGNCGAPVTRQQAGPVCANCGSPNQPGAEFCAECGARLGGDVMPMQSFCPECGAAVKEGAAFCKECGADLNTTAAPAPFVCPGCGEPLPPDAAFCGNCGRVLQQGAEYAPAAPATTAAEYQPSYPPQVQPQQQWQASQQPHKSNRNKMLMAAAAAVVLLAIGITGFWKPGFLLDLFHPTAKLENGMLALNDITLDFKQTNLANGKATLTTVRDKEEEVQNGLIGDLYVMKYDKSCKGKVTVAVPVPKEFKPTNDKGLFIKLGIGRDYPLADGKKERVYSYFDTTIKDGKAVAVIDLAALGRGQHKFKTSAKSAEDASDIGEFTEYVGLFLKANIIDNLFGHVYEYGEGYQYAKGHFRLWYGYNYKEKMQDSAHMLGLTLSHKNVLMKDDAQNLLKDLEEAYNYYKTHGYAEHVDTYTPIDVYINHHIGKGEGNEGAWDPITGNIEIDESKLFNENHRYEGSARTKVRATIYHEVFHAVQQSLIGSQAYISDSKKSNWFDEATGTNFERLVSEGLSDNEHSHFWRLWQGPIPKGSSKEDGYARSLLIRFMSSKLGGDHWIRDCYDNWSEDYGWLKAYMKQIAPTDADFAAKFYLELITKYGITFDANWYHTTCQYPSEDNKRFLSAIRLELDAKAKERIDKGEEDALPVIFTSPSFELEGYGGHVAALVTQERLKGNTQKILNLTDSFPDKCQLKLEAEGGCRIQIVRFTSNNNDIVKGNVIKNIKEETSKGYKYLVLVTSTQPTKQNVVLKAKLEKEELKEGIYTGKATVTMGKKTGTFDNRVYYRLSRLSDGRWGLTVCEPNGDYMGASMITPLTYDAKQKLWKGHRKIKQDVSRDPKRKKMTTGEANFTMKVNLEGKEPVLIIDDKTSWTTWQWGYPTKEGVITHFEGKCVSELKGRNLGAKEEEEGKVIIVE